MNEYNPVFESMEKSLNEGKSLDETVKDHFHHFEESGAGYMSVAYHLANYLQSRDEE